MGDIDWRDVERIEQSARWEEKLAAANAEIASLREERRWIPVEERLPQPGDTVLMLMDGKDPVSGWYENGHFHNAYDEPNVTHWQPLPAPPNGGESP